MDATSELKLTLEHGAEPIAGRLELPDGRVLRFEGYMQLVGILENVRGSAPAHDDGGSREE
ncbi:hypothetical protein [Glycomyces xiaoerkulensis]|uniref:hypothetical protein n=1 Tax=Glycomyces xiaoerkulensis TaxID=2038139 RepID=UPI000C264C27|nr:hypothetical protein [Glycomyces xiaoerkulensis]